MDSREFGEMMIKYGGYETRKKIIIQMKNEGILLPSILLEHLDKLDRTNKNNVNQFIEYFLNSRKIFTQSDFEIANPNELYANFKQEFIEAGFKCDDVPILKQLRNYLREKEEIESKLKNLSELDCELMKLAHIKY